MTWILYVLTGILGGVLGGMGMGGGTVLIPLLGIFLGMNQHLAQAVNLISFVPMAIIALVIHFKNGLVETKGLWKIILAGLVSCVIGCLIVEHLKADILKRIFGGFLMILSIIQGYEMLRKKRG